MRETPERSALEVVADLSRTRAVTPAAVAQTALRHDLLGAEELIVHRGSEGTLDLTAVRAAAATREATPSSLRADAVYALGLLTAGRSILSGDMGDAADLLALGRRLADRDGAPHEHIDLELQTNFVAGHVEHAFEVAADERTDPLIRWAAEADLARAGALGSPEGHGAWLRTFNLPLREAGLVPLDVAFGADLPFDSLRGAVDVAGTVDGPLISIVMPTFRPTQTLFTAVRSLLAQSWGNVEVVVVDDASEADYAPMFERAADIDRRVRVVRADVNGGAYRARNLGIARARGAVVGIQDADDWSHPERLERQMSPFDDSSVVATLSRAIRAFPDLRVTRVGAPPVLYNASSLLMRTEVFRERMGRYDDVRKAADTEFIRRARTVHGVAAVPELKEPLALCQLTSGSLSRADFRFGWHHPARFSYHSAVRHWHSRIAAGEADPRLGDPAGGRPFPAPPEMTGERWADERHDVVILADWREGMTRWTGLVEEVEALSSAGAAVGLARGVAVRQALTKRRRPSARVSEAVARDAASWVPLEADTSTRNLLIRDPELIVCPPDPALIRIRAERVLVAADLPPSPVSGARAYIVSHVEEWVRATFGLAVEWLPATPAVASALVAEGATGKVHDPIHLDVMSPRRVTARSVVGRPVIGVGDLSVLASEKIDRQAVARLLPRGDQHDVRVLSRRQRVPDGRRWLVLDPRTLDLEAFVGSCDFWVDVPTRHWGATPRRPLLEAMAAGCVPLVAPRHEDRLEAAARYLGHQSVAEIVDELWSDPEAYATQQALSLAYCRDLSAAAFAERVAPVLLENARPSPTD